VKDKKAAVWWPFFYELHTPQNKTHP